MSAEAAADDDVRDVALHLMGAFAAWSAIGLGSDPRLYVASNVALGITNREALDAAGRGDLDAVRTAGLREAVAAIAELPELPHDAAGGLHLVADTLLPSPSDSDVGTIERSCSAALKRAARVFEDAGHGTDAVQRVASELSAFVDMQRSAAGSATPDAAAAVVFAFELAAELHNRCRAQFAPDGYVSASHWQAAYGVLLDPRYSDQRPSMSATAIRLVVYALRKIVAAGLAPDVPGAPVPSETNRDAAVFAFNLASALDAVADDPIAEGAR